MIIICLNPQVDSSFEGARKITSEESQAGERFAVQRHEDNLTLGTDLIILVDTVLILSKKRFCEENLDFLFSISQIGRPIGGHPRV